MGPGVGTAAPLCPGLGTAAPLCPGLVTVPTVSGFGDCTPHRVRVWYTSHYCVRVWYTSHYCVRVIDHLSGLLTTCPGYWPLVRVWGQGWLPLAGLESGGSRGQRIGGHCVSVFDHRNKRQTICEWPSRPKVFVSELEISKKVSTYDEIWCHIWFYSNCWLFGIWPVKTPFVSAKNPNSRFC